jgi:hypothetical protein
MTIYDPERLKVGDTFKYSNESNSWTVIRILGDYFTLCHPVFGETIPYHLHRDALALGAYTYNPKRTKKRKIV